MRPPVLDPTWPASVVEIYHNDLREMWNPWLERHSYVSYQNQLRLYFDAVRRFAPQSVLDVGCAQGTLALLLAEAGHRVVAVDIRQPFLDYARTRHERGDVEFRCANIMDGPQLGRFDMVFANQILEHIVQPVGFLERLASYLNPGGTLLVTTPNQQYVRAGLPSFEALGDPSRFASRQNSAGGGDHFFFYRESELKTCARRAGLRVLSLSFFESPWISGHIKFRHLTRHCPVSWLRLADRATLALAGRRLGRHLCLVAARPG
jgi:2-polyprenyl-3-methyl-5-hydroxy-6-metoxy-1,4-benzoquinol methylase